MSGTVGSDNSIYLDKNANMLNIAIKNGDTLGELNTKRMMRSTEQCTTWKFNPPSTLWRGRSLEHLVDFLNQLLKAMLECAWVSGDEEFVGLCDCEGMFSLRPLAYVQHLMKSATDLFTTSNDASIELDASVPHLMLLCLVCVFIIMYLIVCLFDDFLTFVLHIRFMFNFRLI